MYHDFQLLSYSPFNVILLHDYTTAVHVTKSTEGFHSPGLLALDFMLL